MRFSDMHAFTYLPQTPEAPEATAVIPATNRPCILVSDNTPPWAVRGAKLNRTHSAEQHASKPACQRSWESRQTNTSIRSSILRKSLSEPELNTAFNPLWDDDFAVALLGLQGVATRNAQDSEGKEKPYSRKKGQAEIHNRKERRNAQPKSYVAKRMGPLACPGETPQSRRMRKSLEAKGAQMAANVVQVLQTESTWALDEECKGVGDWDRDTGACCRVGGFPDTISTLAASCLKSTDLAQEISYQAHIRLPRHVSRVLMESIRQKKFSEPKSEHG